MKNITDKMKKMNKKAEKHKEKGDSHELRGNSYRMVRSYKKAAEHYIELANLGREARESGDNFSMTRYETGAAYEKAGELYFKVGKLKEAHNCFTNAFSSTSTSEKNKMREKAEKVRGLVVKTYEDKCWSEILGWEK